MFEINKYEFFKQSKLNLDFIKNVKKVYIFYDYLFEINVIIATNENKTYVYGRNSCGVLGFGHVNEVKELTLNEDLSNKQIIDFKCSDFHTIARTIDGKVYSWGRSKCGALGNGRDDFKKYKPELNQYLSGKNIIDICCGAFHSLVLTSDGQIYAWGENRCGQIGNGKNEFNKCVLIPYHVNAFNGEKVKAIACGHRHSMALTEKGNVFSWGSNSRGQLGLKKLIEDESRNVPKPVEIDEVFEKISCGYQHSLLLSRDGNIYVFGWNSYGQLGDEGIKEQSETPLKLKNENNFIDVASHYGTNISMALSKEGIIYIWGSCGIKVIKTPTETQFKGFDHAFAHYIQINLTNLKDIYGPIGNYIIRFDKYKRIENNGRLSNKLNEYFRNNIKFSFVSEWNVIIVTKDDKVYEFERKNLFSNSLLITSDNNKVVKLLDKFIVEELCGKQIVDLKPGLCHAIARTFDGKVYCWGQNVRGVLGIGTENDQIHKPVLNQYLSDKNITDICCGFYHSLALTIEGEVYTWGYNLHGQIGNGSNDDELTPYRVKELNGEKVKSISCGWSHSLALTETGNVFGWGQNWFGQLGNGIEDYFHSPKKIEMNGNTIEKISCGAFHSLLLSNDRDIYLLGSNEVHQPLRYEEINGQSETPLKLKNVTKFIDIASHYYYRISMALSIEGIIYIWDKCGEQILKVPKETNLKSFNDVFAYYEQINYKPIEERIIPFNDTFIRNGEYKRNYYQLEKLGEGSFGIVFKVRRRTYFAIKKMKFNVEIENEFLKELETCSTIKKLSDKRLVEYYDIWFEEDLDESSSRFKSLTLYIQMELCEKSLADIIKEMKCSNLVEDDCLTLLGYYIVSELFIGVLEGVRHLHIREKPLIHRDLKPDNILLKIELNKVFVKIADFGLAVIHKYANELHTADRGHISYAAPEVLKGKKYDTKADIYSLGVIAQELFYIDINSDNVNEENEASLLVSKYRKLSDLSIKMKVERYRDRPNCEEILNEKQSWALDVHEFNAQKEFENFEKSNKEKDLYVLKVIKYALQPSSGSCLD